MSKKTEKFLAELLKKLKKLIPILHSFVVAFDFRRFYRSVKTYLGDANVSDLLFCLTALFVSIAAALVLIFVCILFFGG